MVWAKTQKKKEKKKRVGDKKRTQIETNGSEKKKREMQRVGITPEIVFKVKSSIITAQRPLSYLCCGSILY